MAKLGTEEIKIKLNALYDIPISKLKRTSKKNISNGVERIFNDKYSVITNSDDTEIVSVSTKESEIVIEKSIHEFAIGVTEVDWDYHLGMCVMPDGISSGYTGKDISHILKKFKMVVDTENGFDNCFIRKFTDGDDDQNKSIEVAKKLKEAMESEGHVYDSYHWKDGGEDELNNVVNNEDETDEETMSFSVSIGSPSSTCDSADKDTWRKPCMVQLDCFIDGSDYCDWAYIDSVVKKYKITEHSSEATAKCFFDTEAEALNAANGIRTELLALGLTYDKDCSYSAGTELDDYLKGGRNETF